jgi:hypothetical protein
MAFKFLLEICLYLHSFELFNCGHGTPYTSVPEFIDPVFTKTSPKRSFSLNRKRAFWLVFAKTGSIISGTVQVTFWLMLVREK